MIQIAQTRMKTAASFERHTDNGGELMPDLRRKLD
jgi:hypothetical protein